MFALTHTKHPSGGRGATIDGSRGFPTHGSVAEGKNRRGATIEMAGTAPRAYAELFNRRDATTIHFVLHSVGWKPTATVVASLRDSGKKCLHGLIPRHGLG